jgi:dihydrodipicolinate synthase/N-acetylneuraminate lyase
MTDSVPKRYPRCILATCPIPWREDFTFDEPLFKSTVTWLCEGLSPHIYLFGTAGEGYAVTNRQFQAIARSFRQVLPAEASPMLGVITLSLGEAIERIECGHSLGFRDFQVSLPSWGALTDREVDAFFRETCGRFPDCRFLHYNLGRAKRLLKGDDYARLAAHHPNLVAFKMGGEDVAALTDILTRAPALQGFLTEFGYAALRDRHECGLLAALSAADHDRGRAFFEARGDDLRRQVEDFRAVHRAIKAAIDPAETHMDGAYDKVYVKRLRAEFPLRLLPPYSFPDDDAVARFEQGLPTSWRRTS